MKTTSFLLSGARALILCVITGLSIAQADSAVLTVESSFSAGVDQQFNGIAFRYNGATPMLYAADTANSSYNIFNLSDNSQTSLAVGRSIYAAAAGQGNFTPEYYVSLVTPHTQIVKYNPNDETWGGTSYLTPAILGFESANPYASYSDFWGVVQNANPDTEQPTDNTFALFGYNGATLNTISTIGTGLTDLAVDLSGNVFLLGGSTIYQYTTTGDFVGTYTVDPSIVNPTGIAYDTSTGQFWISNNTSTIYGLTAIPEPSVSALILAGGALILIVRRGRRLTFVR